MKPEACAFPICSGESAPEYGLTKREYFAGLAMQSLIGKTFDNTVREKFEGQPYEAMIAALSTQQADALLSELSKDSEATPERLEEQK